MNKIVSSAPKNRMTLALVGVVSMLLGILLLSLQYSYGVGASTYCLGRYIWSNWSENEDMSHGFFVVPAVCFLIYHNRKRLLSLTPRCGWGGLPLLIGGLILFWAGNQADITFVGLVSIMLVLAGTVWWLLGDEFFRELAFPIGFLIFAIPFPGLDMMVALPLRFIMSKMSVVALNLVGVPVVLVGTGILSAPDAVNHLAAGQKFAVDVANPCSGIHSLFALMMIGALFGYFTLNGLWRKWVLFLCTLPLAVLGNLIRIMMLTIGTVLFGKDFALGKNPLTDPSFFHMAAGYLVFVVALLGMIGIAEMLNKISLVPMAGKKRGKDRESDDQPGEIY